MARLCVYGQIMRLWPDYASMAPLLSSLARADMYRAAVRLYLQQTATMQTWRTGCRETYLGLLHYTRLSLTLDLSSYVYFFQMLFMH